jgi:hypothetical protein
MKPLTFELGDGKMRSIIAPKDSAAWALVISADKSKAVMFFRLKKLNEKTMQTALNNARDEVPAINWQSTGSLPWCETSGGVDAGQPIYFTLQFVQRKGDWVFAANAGLEEYIGSQNDIRGNAAALPSSSSTPMEDLAVVLDFLRQTGIA